MPQQSITTINLADIQTTAGDFDGVAAEVPPSCVMIEDGTGGRWIPRDTITETVECG